MNTTVLTQQPTGTTATIPAQAGRAPRAALLAALLTTTACLLAAIVLSGSAGASSQGAPLGGSSSYSPNVYGWRTVTPVTTSDLRDVFMVSSTDGWAVGNVGTVLRYNGTSWSTFPISTSDTLRDVYMVSPTDGYIIAWHTMDSGSDIYHFDGTSWSLQYTSDQFIYRVDATGPNDVWASGFTRIYHNTGSGWSFEEVPGNMFAIDMTSPTQGWATGAYGVILEFSSGSWTPYTGPVQNTLYETFFTSPTDGWAMGYTETTYVLHNNGTTWSRRYTLPFQIDRIRMFSSTSGWVSGPTTIAYFDGRSFTPVANPTIYNLYGLSMVSPTDGWIVGEAGTMLHYQDDGTPTPVPTSCPVEFNDVPPGNTFYPFVRCLACQAIINGYACGLPGEPCPGSYFRPNSNVTRGQLTKIVAESAGFNNPIAPGTQTFQDVPPGSTFYTYTERLSYLSVMQGYPCGTPLEPCVAPQNRPYFRPGNNATRGQLTKIVSNAADFGDAIPQSQQTFTDVPPTNTFYLYVERLLMNRPGVMGGYACGTLGEPCDPNNRPYFRPNNTLTRGQTSKILSNTFFPNCNPTLP